MGAIASRCLELPESHCPCDVSMTIPVKPEGSWSSGEPVPRPVDLIALRAEVDVRAAISMRRQDLHPFYPDRVDPRRSPSAV